MGEGEQRGENIDTSRKKVQRGKKKGEKLSRHKLLSLISQGLLTTPRRKKNS